MNELVKLGKFIDINEKKLCWYLGATIVTVSFAETKAKCLLKESATTIFTSANTVMPKDSPSVRALRKEKYGICQLA
jgi:hypothetical protein